MDLKNYLEKLRELTDKQKIIVLWTIIGVLAVIMGFFWVRGTVDSLSKVGDSVKSIKLPAMNLPAMPSLPPMNILQTTTPSDGALNK